MKLRFAALCMFIFSCNSIQDKGDCLNDDTLVISSSVLKKSDIDSRSFKEEMNAQPKVYISILPGDKWIDSMQQINGEEGWNEVVADNEYYRNQTETYLKSKGYIEIDEPKDKIWSIKRPNFLVKTIHSDTLADKWGVIIFNGNNDPVFYDGMEPEIDLDTL
jgi:hypothetical protein